MVQQLDELDLKSQKTILLMQSIKQHGNFGEKNLKGPQSIAGNSHLFFKIIIVITIILFS